MLNRFGYIAHKFRYELEGLMAIARYPLHKDALIARLSSIIPSITIETTVTIRNAARSKVHGRPTDQLNPLEENRGASV